MKKQIKWNSGVFFYIFYFSFIVVCVVFAVNAINYVQGRGFDSALTSKSLCIIIGFFCAFHTFRKKRKMLMDIILGTGTEGIRNALADNKMRNRVDGALHTTLQFGGKKGMKQFEKALKKAESYDDKAVICCIQGIVYDAAGKTQEALKCYDTALQYRPYYELAEMKIEETLTPA